MSRSRGLHVNRVWAAIIQCSAFVRKEIAEVVRQPRLILLLIVGPFALLLLFGTGYGNQAFNFRTLFVGPQDSFYERALTQYRDRLQGFVDPVGYTDQAAAARAALAEGQFDIVVLFPPDPLGDISAGRRAEITVLHNQLDPIQRAAVTVAAQLAVEEINTSILTAIASGAQAVLDPADVLIAELTEQVDALARSVAAGDADAVAANAEDVAVLAADMERIVGASRLVLERLGAANDVTTSRLLTTLDEISAEARRLQAGGVDDVGAATDSLASNVAIVAEAIPSITTVDPAVLVRPFRSTAEFVAPVPVDAADYYAPSSLALLVQHLAVTIAALSVVRDRQLGLFELLRVGPVSSIEILAGKTIAYLAIGMVVGVGLFASAVHLLDVPFVGSLVWVLAALVLVLLASLALGLGISLVSTSETQAVQWAMLSLLAGLFFSGFVLDLAGISYPVKAISWLLPVTYGIRLLRDIMLTGVEPDPTDLYGLAALIVVYGGFATILLRRQLRTA